MPSFYDMYHRLYSSQELILCRVIVTMKAMTERFQPTDSFALPPELIEAIKDDDYACLTLATNRGTAIVVKVPDVEIDRISGTFPIQMRHELFGHPASPVIRLTATLYDDPDNPLLLETFINVGEADQRADYAAFAEQDEIPLLFYDQRHQHRLAKTVGNGSREQIPRVVQAADELLAGIPAGAREFDRAKADVILAVYLGREHDQEERDGSHRRLSDQG